MTTITAEKRPRSAVSLLSFDGGGPRGISQLEILKHVLEKISGDTDDIPLKRPCEVFAMIGGTGTGGLIAIFLVVLEMTVNDALETFTDFVNKVFKEPDHNPIKQSEKLRKAINDIFAKDGIKIWPNANLVPPNGTPACKLLIPVLDQKNTGIPIILTNYRDRQSPPTTLTVAEAMLATCASPPLFSPVKVIKDFSMVEYIAADHGLSNPTREIISSAHRTFGGEMPVVCLLSIGSGHPGVNISPDDSQTTPRITFLERIAMDSERTAQEIASQMGKLTLYHRLSVGYGMETTEYQAWKEPSDIIAQTRNYLNDEETGNVTNQCVSTLKDGTGFTTLECLKFSGEDVLAPELLELTPNYVERKTPTEFLETRVLDGRGGIKGGSKKIIVTGMGGCGKTQLVRKFIEDHRDLFAPVFFVDGSSEETLKSDLTHHVRSLGGPHSQKSFQESMKFLSLPVQGGERLLVIDNADNPKINISPFLPKWKRGTVILTSRNASHGQLSPSSHLKLDVMDKDESIELLNLGSGGILGSNEDDESGSAIAEELGYLPIALVQAASYIFRTECSAKSYISLLRTSRERILSDPATSQVDMRYTTAFAAFDASYSLLPSNSQKTLHLLSFMHRQKFPVECISFDAKNGFSFQDVFLDTGDEYELGKECLKKIFYSSEKWDPAEVDAIITSLRNHSLVTLIRTDNTRLLQMHPLVHEWARLRIPKEDVGRFQNAAVRLLSCNAHPSNYLIIQYLQAHVQALSSIWETLHMNDMASFGYILTECGAHGECLRLREHLRLTAKVRLGTKHPTTLVVSTTLGDTYRRLGRYSEAAEVEVESLKLSTELLGAEDMLTLRVSMSLSETYFRMGRYTEAEAMNSEVLELLTKSVGVDHPWTVQVSGNLALNYSQLGRYAEAEVLAAEVVKQKTKSFGVDHPHTIRASMSLASIYVNLGQYNEAAVLGGEVVKQLTKLLGADHPDTIVGSANLALTYAHLGQYAEAEVLQVEVLKQQTMLLGVDHPDTILASANLIGIYIELGRYAEAEVLQVEVLKQRKELLGVDHPDTIVASANLAGIYGYLGKHAEAEVLEIKVLEKQKKLLGDDHPFTMLASTNLATTYGDLGRYAEAEVLLVETLKQHIKVLGVEHPHTILVSGNLAATYNELGRYAEAEKLGVEVLKQRKKLLGVDHPGTIVASANLAFTYSELGRHDEAEKLKVEVLKQRKKLLGVDHPDTIMASANLAVTYSELGRHDEAEVLEAEVLKHRTKLLGGHHPKTIQASENLAITYGKLGRFAEAEVLQTEVLKHWTNSLGVHHPNTTFASTCLGITYRNLGRYAEAEQLQTSLLQQNMQLLGDHHPDTINSMRLLASTYEMAQKYSEALELAKRAHCASIAALGEDHRYSQRLAALLASIEDSQSVNSG